MEKINLNNLTNILEILEEPVRKYGKGIYSFLRTCNIVDVSQNKIILSCDYNFHKNPLENNKQIIEKCLSDILKVEVIVEFILFNKAVELGYELALKEKNRRKEAEEKKREQEKEELKLREQKLKAERIKENIENRIPPKFKNAELNKSLKIIQDYCLKEKYKEKGLFLFGNFGTGKTYNIYALAKYLIMNDINVWVFNLPRLLNTIRASFSKQEVCNEDTGESSYAFVKDMSSIEKLIDIEILIIDDIGAEKPSDWVAETLYYLINSRYEEEKITIFTSNLSLDKLSDRIGDRIVSRIAEMCDVYEMEGKDRRIHQS